MKIVLLIIVLILIVVILVSCISIVPQATAYIIERLGGYQATWNVGVHMRVPLIDKVANKISIKEQVADFLPQPVITKDNVTMQIDTVIFYEVTDPKLYTYGVENPISAIENLTATTLRNIIGDMELDDTLTSRETINAKMRAALDEATDPWGIKINRVELKNIIPPEAIEQAMERQMKAEREKREAILKSQGEKESEITIAEGRKQAAILKAESESRAVILKAEATKEAMLKEAEGRAAAIRMTNEAKADGIKVMNAANATEEVLHLRGLEAFEHAADGQATKIIIPSDLQGIAGKACAVKESVL